MQFYSFEVVIEKEAEDEGYCAWSPSLPGCFSNGRTIEDAKRNIRNAVTQHVTALLARVRCTPKALPAHIGRYVACSAEEVCSGAAGGSKKSGPAKL